MAFILQAFASDPTSIVLKWQNVFAAKQLDNETITELADLFMTQGFETYAAVVVNRVLIASKPNAAMHAEVMLLNSSDWTSALDTANQSARKGIDTSVTVLINRAPCRQCTKVLIAEITKQRARQQSGTLSRRIKFILAPTGIYEPTNQKQRREIATKIAEELVKKQKISIKKALKKAYKDKRVPEPSLDPNTTQLGDLVALEASGWELRQLLARPKATVSGQILAEAIATVRKRVAREFNELEHVD
jgi:hypothetical protein